MEILVGLGFLLIIGAILALVYFLPSIIAYLSGSSYLAPIVIVNFFLGWSLIGWVVALAWAVMPERRY